MLRPPGASVRTVPSDFRRTSTGTSTLSEVTIRWTTGATIRWANRHRGDGQLVKETIKRVSMDPDTLFTVNREKTSCPLSGHQVAVLMAASGPRGLIGKCGISAVYIEAVSPLRRQEHHLGVATGSCRSAGSENSEANLPTPVATRLTFNMKAGRAGIASALQGQSYRFVQRFVERTVGHRPSIWKTCCQYVMKKVVIRPSSSTSGEWTLRPSTCRPQEGR